MTYSSQDETADCPFRLLRGGAATGQMTSCPWTVLAALRGLGVRVD